MKFHPVRHFITITKHRNEVVCPFRFKAGIGFQGLFHDLSKYSPTEFIPGAKYYSVPFPGIFHRIELLCPV